MDNLAGVINRFYLQPKGEAIKNAAFGSCGTISYLRDLNS
ncbi:hypothetical protein SVI_3539 [Shewanella violacea DSS12]|uniref:Uncharacterized protein n=1 Tax=Shewanella violacea (strain JCM 10179 / CIP 106290 / LMG 19151 / DSS12) TaxID=637905 RepID=D4ZBW5_SHEVD|nr:hypothetical protein SVI_3539 [Shewanella violacea DSS12]